MLPHIMSFEINNLVVIHINKNKCWFPRSVFRWTLLNHCWLANCAFQSYFCFFTAIDLSFTFKFFLKTIFWLDHFLWFRVYCTLSSIFYGHILCRHTISTQPNVDQSKAYVLFVTSILLIPWNMNFGTKNYFPIVLIVLSIFYFAVRVVGVKFFVNGFLGLNHFISYQCYRYLFTLIINFVTDVYKINLK